LIASARILASSPGLFEPIRVGAAGLEPATSAL
jgi:hypothetical protein